MFVVSSSQRVLPLFESSPEDESSWHQASTLFKKTFVRLYGCIISFKRLALPLQVRQLMLHKNMFYLLGTAPALSTIAAFSTIGGVLAIMDAAPSTIGAARSTVGAAAFSKVGAAISITSNSWCCTGCCR